MTGSAISISPWALAIAVIAYVLKRWWDNADDITKERRVAYSRYYTACYSFVNVALGTTTSGRAEKLKNAHEILQDATPDFYLHASPTAIIVSDVFFERSLPFIFDNTGSIGSDEFVQKANELSEALNVLREVLKSEMYTLSPRFQIERWHHKPKYNDFIRDAKK